MRLFRNLDAHRGSVTRVLRGPLHVCCESRIKPICEMNEFGKIDSFVYRL